MRKWSNLQDLDIECTKKHDLIKNCQTDGIRLPEILMLLVLLSLIVLQKKKHEKI